MHRALGAKRISEGALESPRDLHYHLVGPVSCSGAHLVPIPWGDVHAILAQGHQFTGGGTDTVLGLPYSQAWKKFKGLCQEHRYCLPSTVPAAHMLLCSLPPGWLSRQVKLGVPGKGQEARPSQHLRGPPPGLASPPSRAGEGPGVDPRALLAFPVTPVSRAGMAFPGGVWVVHQWAQGLCSRTQDCRKIPEPGGGDPLSGLG